MRSVDRDCAACSEVEAPPWAPATVIIVGWLSDLDVRPRQPIGRNLLDTTFCAVGCEVPIDRNIEDISGSPEMLLLDAANSGAPYVDGGGWEAAFDRTSGLEAITGGSERLRSIN